jgi:molecular chaperone GrpE
MTEQHQNESELERRLREKAEAESSTEHSHAALPSEEVSNPTAPEEEVEDPLEGIDPVAALTEECDELRDQLLRKSAEFDNYRKRTAREVERIRKTAAESLIHELLTVLDNLGLALSHVENESDPLAQGVTMVHKQMDDILRRNGLEPIEASGKPFDPNVHEAVAQVDSEEVPPGHVVQEYQRGYTLGGQILRPAKVVVSSETSTAARDA